jgi:hypothetical protein
MNFVIRNFVIRNFVIRNFDIRNLVPAPGLVLTPWYSASLFSRTFSKHSIKGETSFKVSKI